MTAFIVVACLAGVVALVCFGVIGYKVLKILDDISNKFDDD